MVAKISSGNNLYGVLSYNFDKVEKEKGIVLGANKMRYDTNGQIDIHSAMNDFNLLLKDNIRTEKPIIHISLNPHPDDKLDNEKLAEIGKEYIEKMGYGNQPYIIYKHEDIDRHHLHIVSLRVDENGKKLDDKFEKRRSVKVLQELEMKYNLIPAKGQKQDETHRFKKVDIKSGDIKKQIGNTIKSLSQKYYFQSFKEYRALLSLYNISVEEVKGEAKGKAYNGLVYFATNDKGEKVSNPFKSSLFGKSVGFEAINQKAETSKIYIKDKKLRDSTKRAVAYAMKHYPQREKFEKELSKSGIDVIFRENTKGRIYGVTFIDHNNSCVFNGSRLGKEFSANTFQEMFDNPNTTPPREDVEPDDIEQSEQQFDLDEDAMGGLLDLFSIDSQGDNPEEDAFRRRMQKKKRKGRRL